MTCADRLALAKSRPLVVEGAVRTALRDCVAWRIGGGSAPSADAFVAAAVAAARLSLDAAGCDATERSRALTAVHQVTARFTRSALCRRLMNVPPSKLVRLPRTADSPDVIVRDTNRRLHATAITARADALEAGRVATRVAAATPLPLADRLVPLTVHVFSLATGHRRTFERDVLGERANRLIDARVA
jgi:hypothetical protein